MFENSLIYLLSGIGAYRTARVVSRARISSLRKIISCYEEQLEEYLNNVENLKQSHPSVTCDGYALKNFMMVENIIRVELSSARRNYLQEKVRMKERGVEGKVEIPAS